ncbi:hypothetical protein B0A48_18614 [Cryoendolithus antarcticus]|uniref:Altered inheritance of mitochondria protein 6 n=1 Tax=Cryoendolithus antarcticus TaxID=1507870 RepID=A0A1V8S8L4_9PEZI|nr:hypothetical protein B0A48_18614 [Cryoendolithus antarcticus]
MGLKRGTPRPAFSVGKPLSGYPAGENALDDDLDDAEDHIELSELRTSDFLPGLGSYQQHGPMRRCNRFAVRACFKRAMIAIPCLALMFLGAIHALQVLIGRSRLIWNLLPDQAFPPSFGRLSYDSPSVATTVFDDVQAAPIPCHSHNDYWRARPLFDAVAAGKSLCPYELIDWCTGVEADVWLFDDQLFVGHAVQSLRRDLTFRRLYVDPLVDLLDRKIPEVIPQSVTVPQPSVFERAPNQTLVLLVGLKTAGLHTLDQVRREIQPLRDRGYLTYYDGEKRVDGPITVVATGHAPFHAVVSNERHRDIFFDAPLEQLWQEPRSSPATDDDGAAGTLDYGDVMVEIEETGSDHVGPDIVANEEYNATNSFYASASFHSAVGVIRIKTVKTMDANL